jgi:hypothetical protein
MHEMVMIRGLEVGSCGMGLWICSIVVMKSNHGLGYDFGASFVLCYSRWWLMCCGSFMLL